MDPTPPTPDPYEPPPPKALLSDLRRLAGAAPAVPAELDHRIVEQGFHGAAVRRRWRRAIGWGAWAAAAAALLALATSVWGPRGAAPRPVAERTITGDFDGSGHVDILDAFALARVIAARRPLDAAWDLNHDGRVDQADVDMLAATAVSVSDRGSSARRIVQ